MASIARSAARWERPMPASSASDLTRRRASKKSPWASTWTAFARRKSATSSGKSRGATADSTLAARHARRTSSGVSSCQLRPADQLVEPELLERHRLQARDLLQPRKLERAHVHRARAAAAPRTRRVGDGHRHLVPQLGRADRCRRR